MLFSGSALIKSAGNARERFEVLAGGKSKDKSAASNAVEVAAVDPSQSADSQLSKDSQNNSKDALLRFAKFIDDKKIERKNRERSKPRKSGLQPQGYFSFEDDSRGKLLNIYA